MAFEKFQGLLQNKVTVSPERQSIDFESKLVIRINVYLNLNTQ